jgi:hypothetical protein
MAKQNPIVVGPHDAEIEQLLDAAEHLEGAAKVAVLSAAFNLAAFGSQAGRR